MQNINMCGEIFIFLVDVLCSRPFGWAVGGGGWGVCSLLLDMLYHLDCKLRSSGISYDTLKLVHCEKNKVIELLG